MNIFESIILGIIQGITEFLPISSTGHLTLAGRLMGLISDAHPEQWTSFIAVIQLGTLASILVYFRDDIRNIVTAFSKESLWERRRYREQSLNSRLGWLILIGTLPVVVVGLLFKAEIEGVLTKNLYVIAASLIILALVLAFAEKVASHKKQIAQVGVLDALVVGIAQAFALIPGSSRSGTTLTGGLLMGMNREAAARFSFLLSIPAIFASGILELYEATRLGIDSLGAVNYVVATVVSGISGYCAIDFLLKYLRKNTTFLFVYYRIALGALILGLLATGRIVA
ncbi:MAG: undecaprenyl-diphosphatase UppP [Syntrophales bacterium]